MGKQIVIGKENNIHQQAVTISDTSRRLSVYIIGTPGMGKSSLLENIAFQDIENGDGVCFIDPHGTSAETLLAVIPPNRERDVIYWYPYDITRPFGLNPFVCDPDDALAVSVTAQNFVSTLESLAEFSDVFAQGTRMKDMLLNIGYAFIANQGHSFIEAVDFIAVDYKAKDDIDGTQRFRETFYSNLSRCNPIAAKFWRRFDKLPLHDKRERTESTANKLRRFSNDPIMQGIFSQVTNSINFQDVIKHKKILILNLSDIGSYNAAFIGAFVVSGLWQAAQALYNPRDNNKSSCHLIADEFENYMTTVFPRIQKQGRKYGIDAVIAHQERSGLSDEIKGSTLSVNNKVVFNISGRDAVELAREFKKIIPAPQILERQTFTLATQVLEAIKSHEDQAIVAQGHVVREVIDRIFVYAAAQHDHEEVLYAHARTTGVVIPLPSPTYTQHLHTIRKRVEETVDVLLFAMMSAKSQEELPALWEGDGRNEQRLVSLAEEVYGHVFSQADRTAVARRRTRERDLADGSPVAQLERQSDSRSDGSFLWNRTALLWEWERDLRQALLTLGTSLWKQPCYSRSSQIEAPPGPQRSYSDVEAEIANRLANLPLHTACITIIENGKPATYTISTPTPVTPIHKDATRSERLKQRSREAYGRDRSVVEEEIRKRLPDNSVQETPEKSTKARPSRTPQQPVPPVQPHLGDDEEDDIILRD